jgi:hypothetical protein
MVSVSLDVPVDDGQRDVGGPADRIEDLGVVDRHLDRRESVDLLAGDLARTAPDAQCGVVQEAVSSGIALELPDGPGFCRSGSQSCPDRTPDEASS